MRQLTRVICCTAALAVMTGCGTQTGSTSGSTPTSKPSVFPLTITRTGGIAGFQDVLVVASDGLVSVTQKVQSQRRCQLTPEATKRLIKAASTVPWPQLTAGSTTASFPDDLVTMVTSRAGGPIRLEDPQVSAAGPVFAELVNDLSGGRSASGMCKPV
jgi:hypothetical protein